VITVPKRHEQTDRQTDGRMTYCGITALCVVERGKNYSATQLLGKLKGIYPS